MLFNSNNAEISLFKKHFEKENFNEEEFIVDIRKHSDLKNVLDILKICNKNLSSEIIENMNENYIEYIILSNYASNLGKFIKRLSHLVLQLKLDVFTKKSSVVDTLISANVLINEKNSNAKAKMTLRYVIDTFVRLEKVECFYVTCFEMDSISLHSLERMALDISLIEFRLNKIMSFKNVLRKKEKLETASKFIENQLKLKLLDSVNENKIEELITVLRIYSILDKRSEACNIYCEYFLKPFLQNHLSKESISKYGLEKVYSSILGFIQEHYVITLATMLKINENREKIEEYDIFSKAIWSEVLMQLLNVIPFNIYMPENTNQFHRNYSVTMTFLDTLERYCLFSKSNNQVRKESEFIEFTNKWNLEAYFQIRFLEIAGAFERTLNSENHFCERENGEEMAYVLKQSNMLLNSIKLCWENEIYLPELCQYFWKLTLQLISRYITWFYSLVSITDKQNIQIQKLCSAFMVDIRQIMIDFEMVYEEKICLTIPRSCIAFAFQDSMQLMKNASVYVERILIEVLSKQCCSHVFTVKDIPRLYWKTNRDFPTKPSEYVNVMHSTITDFCSETSFIMSRELSSRITRNVLNIFVNEWATAVEDVRTSVKKMQESFKVLKRSKNKQLSQKNKSDDQKIKTQLLLDANFIDGFYESLELKDNEVADRVKKITQNLKSDFDMYHLPEFSNLNLNVS